MRILTSHLNRVKSTKLKHHIVIIIESNQMNNIHKNPAVTVIQECTEMKT